MTKTRFMGSYGSNLSESQMRYRCPDAKIVGTAEIIGYELLFKGSLTGSYATIEKKRGSKVPILVWEISERDEANLDYYEGVAAGFYYKKDFGVMVTGLNGKDIGKVEAMVYIMDERREIGLPSRRYYEVLREGYNRFGFELTVLQEALKKSRSEKTVR